MLSDHKKRFVDGNTNESKQLNVRCEGAVSERARCWGLTLMFDRGEVEKNREAKKKSAYIREHIYVMHTAHRSTDVKVYKV